MNLILLLITVGINFDVIAEDYFLSLVEAQATVIFYEQNLTDYLLLQKKILSCKAQDW